MVNKAYGDAQVEHDRYLHDLDLLKTKITYQFFVFLVILIFTSLSLSIQFQSHTTCVVNKMIEVISWVLFAISGVLGLRLLRILGEKIKTLEWVIWVLFISALVLQMISKIAVAFES